MANRDDSRSALSRLEPNDECLASRLVARRDLNERRKDAARRLPLPCFSSLWSFRSEARLALSQGGVLPPYCRRSVAIELSADDDELCLNAPALGTDWWRGSRYPRLRANFINCNRNPLFHRTTERLALSSFITSNRYMCWLAIR